eukprot:8388850-Ditylum_brightwellii.AAC.1
MTMPVKQPFTRKTTNVAASNLTLCSSHSSDNEGEVSASTSIDDDKQDLGEGMSVEDAKEGFFDSDSVNESVTVVSSRSIR